MLSIEIKNLGAEPLPIFFFFSTLLQSQKFPAEARMSTDCPAVWLTDPALDLFGR